MCIFVVLIAELDVSEAHAAALVLDARGDEAAAVRLHYELRLAQLRALSALLARRQAGGTTADARALTRFVDELLADG